MLKSFFLKVLSDFINGNRTEPATDVNWREILSYAGKHQVTGIVYYQCKDFINDSDAKSIFLNQYMHSLYRSTNLEKNYDLVSEHLTELKIPFVPVKGFQIAKLYIAPELRTMGDIDILASISDFKSITNAFLNLGFHCGKEEDHEITFRKDSFYYEIHELMVNRQYGEDEIQKSFYNEYWKHLVTDGSYGEQKLDWSFHFLYLLQHMRQHILWEGIGFRQFMDMAIVIRKVDLDWKYIVESTKKIEMYDFLCIVLGFVDAWFGVKSPITVPVLQENVYSYCTNKVFEDGVFGACQEENKTNVFEKEYRKSNRPLTVEKMCNIINVLFPTYKSMSKTRHYSFLKNRPYLLPYAWVYRYFYSWKHKNFKQVKQMKRIVALSEEDMDRRRADIEMWGL